MVAVNAARQPVFLIDASIYIFQAHFSPYVECLSRRGDDLSALYGFTRFLLQFLARTQPECVAVAHDESLFCGFRHDLCSRYKSNRELPDTNLERQMQACFALCDVLGLRAYSSRRYEADDIIGVIARRVRRRRGGGLPVRIVTRDKDLAQLLLFDDDSLWDYQGDRLRHRADIVAEMGIEPEQIPDYLGLAGDAVDCIGGVPGIGPVKARRLLQHFCSLEAIYDDLERVRTLPLRGAGRVAELLEAHREEAVLGKRLATIVCELQDSSESFGQCTVQYLRRRSLDLEQLLHFLDEYCFDAAAATRLMRLAEQAGAPG